MSQNEVGCSAIIKKRNQNWRRLFIQSRFRNRNTLKKLKLWQTDTKNNEKTVQKAKERKIFCLSTNKPSIQKEEGKEAKSWTISTRLMNLQTVKNLSKFSRVPPLLGPKAKRQRVLLTTTQRKSQTVDLISNKATKKLEKICTETKSIMAWSQQL